MELKHKVDSMYQNMIQKRAESRSINESARVNKEQLIDIIQREGRFLSKNAKGQLVVLFVQERPTVHMDRVGLAARLNMKRSTLTTTKIAELAKKGKLTPELIAEYERHDTQIVLRTKKASKTELEEFKANGRLLD